MSKGIDYGHGLTNIDLTTGIRFGVIPQNDVLEAWADSSEPEYGDPTCPKCGNNATDAKPEGADAGSTEEYDGSGEYACAKCHYLFDGDEAFGDEPNSYSLQDATYHAHCGTDGDIFITKSLYYTRAAFCSPCAPGACYLRSPIDDGEKTYCFGSDWFDNDVAPYPVYRVADDSKV